MALLDYKTNYQISKRNTQEAYFIRLKRLLKSQDALKAAV